MKEWIVELISRKDAKTHGHRRTDWTRLFGESRVDTLEDCICELTMKHRRWHVYTYRIRNVKTGEIIPGELFCASVKS